MKKINLLVLPCLFFLTQVSGQSLQSKSIMFKQESLSAPTSTDAEKSDASDPSDYAEYGSKLGIGICILDGFGVPIRYYVSPKTVLEAGFYTSGVTFVYNDEVKIGTGLTLGGGASFFGNRFLKVKKKKNKVRAHGVAIRARQLFGDFRTTSATLGWAMETFKENRTNRSFIFELGLQGNFPNFDYQGLAYEDAGAGVYLRCHWNFFIR